MSVTNLNIPGKLALTVDGLFTDEECHALILKAETQNGYAPAGLNTGVTQKLYKEVRDCQRWINDDPDLAGKFYEKIGRYLPENPPGNPHYHLVGLNERLRFLKYAKGQYFKRHYDGEYERPDGSERSFVTVQIYLNTVKSGGETNFYGRGGKIASVVPKPGRVLIFEHEILHDGGTIVDGVKHVIRTDVMCSKSKDRTPYKPSEEELAARKFFDEAVDCEMQGRPMAAVPLYKKAFKMWPALQEASGVIL